MIFESNIAQIIRDRSTNWKWRFYEYWRSLETADRKELLWSFDSPFDVPLTVVERAECFQAIWNSEQVWEFDADLARFLMLIFHDIEGDARSPEEREYVAWTKTACPHLTEIDNSDLNWDGYQLPVERNVTNSKAPEFPT
jgi:hypothetical protein